MYYNIQLLKSSRYTNDDQMYIVFYLKIFDHIVIIYIKPIVFKNKLIFNLR